MWSQKNKNPSTNFLKTLTFRGWVESGVRDNKWKSEGCYELSEDPWGVIWAKSMWSVSVHSLSLFFVSNWTRYSLSISAHQLKCFPKLREVWLQENKDRSWAARKMLSHDKSITYVHLVMFFLLCKNIVRYDLNVNGQTQTRPATSDLRVVCLLIFTNVIFYFSFFLLLFLPPELPTTGAWWLYKEYTIPSSLFSFFFFSFFFPSFLPLIGQRNRGWRIERERQK